MEMHCWAKFVSLRSKGQTVHVVLQSYTPRVSDIGLMCLISECPNYCLEIVCFSKLVVLRLAINWDEWSNDRSISQTNSIFSMIYNLFNYIIHRANLALQQDHFNYTTSIYLYFFITIVFVVLQSYTPAGLRHWTDVSDQRKPQLLSRNRMFFPKFLFFDWQ